METIKLKESVNSEKITSKSFNIDLMSVIKKTDCINLEKYNKVESSICLDINNWYSYAHIFKMRQFNSIKEIPKIPHGSWEYIYAIEVDNGQHLKIGYSKCIKSRLNEHMNNPESPLYKRCGRIGLIGPIRDGINTEQIIHCFMEHFYSKNDFPDSLEIYSKNIVIQKIPSILNIFHTPENINMFDLFCGTQELLQYNLFDLIQHNYWELSYERCLYRQDLIIPNINFIKEYEEY